MFKGLRKKIHFYMVVIGIAVIIAGFIASGVLESFNETAVETAASIVEIVEPDGMGTDDLKGTVVYVEYIVDGQTYREELGYHEDDMITGQTVMVKYNPEDPADMRAAEGPDTVKTIYILGACICGAGILLNIMMNASERRAADRRAERRYERKMK